MLKWSLDYKIKVSDTAEIQSLFSIDSWIFTSEQDGCILGKNMLCDKQAQRYTGSGHTWLISENAMLCDPLKMLKSAKK